MAVDCCGHVDTVLADAGRTALLPITSDVMANLAEAGQLFDVDRDQVSGMLPLVALDWMFGLEIPQPPQTKAIEHPGHGGEGCSQQPGDGAEVEPLVTEIQGMLQLLRRTLRRSTSAAAPPER